MKAISYYIDGKTFSVFLVLNFVQEEKQIHSVVYDGKKISSLAVFFFQH